MSDREIDLRILTADQIDETDASRASRQAAEQLGPVEGSSYSTRDGRPVLWAFDIARGPRRVILAGAEDLTCHVVLVAAPEHAFTAMLYGKSIAASSTEAIEPHAVTLIEAPPDAGWFCDSFYLSRVRIDGMAPGDVVAVAMHACEVGLGEDAVEAAILRRSPDLVSSPDPAGSDPAFRHWMKIVRSLRRLLRLRELAGPEIIIANEIDLATRTWQRLGMRPLASWPDDVLPVAGELFGA